MKAKHGSLHFDLKTVDSINASSKSPWKYISKQRELIYHIMSSARLKMVLLLHFGPTHGMVTAPYVRLSLNCMLLPISRTYPSPVWNNDTGFWLLNFRRTFKDDEIVDWAELTNHIPNVALT